MVWEGGQMGGRSAEIRGCEGGKGVRGVNCPRAGGGLGFLGGVCGSLGGCTAY